MEKTFLSILKKLNLDEKEKELLKKAFYFVEEKWKRRKRNDYTHDLLHIINVLNYSLKIIEEEKLELKKEDLLSLIISILFHDTGLFFVEKPFDIEKSKEIFLEFFDNLNEKEKTLLDKEKIIKSIEEHSFKSKKEQTNLISKILYDADKLSALGFYGLLRMAIYEKRTILDLDKEYIKEIRDFFNGERKGYNDKEFLIEHLFVKLFKIKERLNFNFSKRKAEELYEKMIYFVEELEREIKQY